MVKILIIEDDYVWQTKIETMLNSYEQFEIIGFAENPSKALQLVDFKKPDLIISEVCLGSENILTTLSTLFNNYPTVFLSPLQNQDAFASIIKFPNSVFQLKPIHEYNLISILFNIIKNSPKLFQDAKFLSFRGLKGGILKIGFEDIIKIEVDGNYSIFFTCQKKRFAKKVSLNSIFKLLDERFLRINKSTIVNAKFISKVDNFHKFVIVNEQTYHVGRPYVKMIKDYNFNLVLPD